MRKTIAFGICAIMGMSAFAQEAVVKEAEKAQKKGAPYTEVVTIITPALSNPETSKSVRAYLIPADAGFKQYDKMFEQRMAVQATGFGQMPTPAEEKAACEALVGAYGYYMQALPLDSLPDEKGKVKPKNSGKIIKEIGGHLEDFNRSAGVFYEAEDYPMAYESWDIYTDIVENPIFAKAIVAPADTILNAIYFNKGLAAYFAKDQQKTYDAMMEAKAKGFNKKVLFDISIPAAIELGDTVAFEQLNIEANELFGATEPSYINNIINLRLNNKEYDKAINMINAAIAQNPNNENYYFLMGIIYSNKGEKENAIKYYKDAININSEFSQAYFNYGLELYTAAMALNDEGPTDPVAYNKFFKENVEPMILDAIDQLEKAWSLNNDLSDALKILQEAYYNVGNEKMEQDVANRMKY